MKLEPSECHTPGCVFFLCHMAEVRAVLNRVLLRPEAYGKPIFTDDEAISQGIVLSTEA
jgi:hypothetical protein